jgi:hypothetical protein
MIEEATAEVEESGFDMDGALDTMSNDLFPKDESEAVEIVEEAVEVEAEPEKEEKAELSEVDKALKEELDKKQEVKEEPARKAPNSWKKEMHEFYNGLDPAVQDYIDRREQQMHDGIEKDRGDANLGRSMRDIMMPYEAMFKQNGIDSVQGVQRLLSAHNMLSTGSPEQRQAYMQQLAQSYGIGKPAEGVDPQVTSLTQRLGNIEHNLSASHQRTQQETKTRIQAEVDTFAQDHPHLDDLSDDIAIFINGGLSLEDAYEKALWSNPATRQTELDSQAKSREKEAEKAAKKEAEEAKKAKSVNVRGRDTKNAPTEPLGTMEDTMRETFRKIKSR